MALLTKVGTFTKPTSLGSQVITGVGFTPKAILFWSAGETADGTWATSFASTIGFTAGPASSYAIGTASQAGQSMITNASRRSSAKAITFVLWGETTIGEADLTSFDADGFTLNWTAANTDAFRIHYLALGGSDLTDAKVINWQAATSSGNQPVIGIGFQPDCVLHIMDGHPNALPRSVAHASLLLGAMDKDGGQWVNGYFSVDFTGKGDAQRVQLTDACLAGVTNTPTIDAKASYVSMDADGFTVNWSNPPSSASQVMSLCLKGGKFKAGSFNKTTNTTLPAAQTVTGVPFQPTGVLFASNQNVASVNPTTGTMQGLGATDGTSEAASALTEEDGANPTNVDRLGKTTKAFIVANNGTQTINAEADLSSFNGSGFSLSWTTNHSTATQIFYLAVGSGTSLMDETAGSVTVLATLSGTAVATFQEDSGVVDALVTSEGVDTQTFNEVAGSIPVLVVLSAAGGQTFDETANEVTLIALLSGEDFKGFNETSGAVTILATLSGAEQSVFNAQAGVAVLKGRLAGSDTLAFYEESGEVTVLVQAAGIDRLVSFLTDPIVGVFVSIDQPITGTVYLDSPFSSFIRTTAR